MAKGGKRLNQIIAMVIPFFAGWLLDILLGDPAWMPHPARLIDMFINNLEPTLRGVFPHTPKGEILAGNLLALLVPLVSMLIAALLLAFSWLISPALWMALDTLLCYQLMGTRKLCGESMKVCRLLENKDEQGDLSRARLSLSRIVTQDTGTLNRREITSATVEAVAENANFNVIAPMFFLAIGGGAFGIFYRAVNSLASLARHGNEKYRYFGTASVKLDDICGFIPARLAAVLMMFSVWLAGFDYRNAARVFRRDRFNHESPNSAQTASVCAGALGISLGGGNFHDGVYNLRQNIGNGDARSAETGDIRGANRIVRITSLFGVLLLGFLKLAILYIIL